MGETEDRSRWMGGGNGAVQQMVSERERGARKQVEGMGHMQATGEGHGWRGCFCAKQCLSVVSGVVQCKVPEGSTAAQLEGGLRGLGWGRVVQE